VTSKDESPGGEPAPGDGAAPPGLPKISRRKVLGAAAAGAGALAVSGTSLSRVAGALPRPPELNPRKIMRDPTLSGIDHVVVVMMENRSFDHFLGWLPGANGIQAGLQFKDKSGVSHPTWHLDTFQGLQYGDPDHSYDGGRIQLRHGACDGWLKAGTDDLFPIGYYEQDDLDFLGNAAPYWTTCDRFHASILGPTFPNRLYMHAAQTDRISNTQVGTSLPTIWDSLATASLSGRYYYTDLPISLLWGTRFIPISSKIPQFMSDCANGTLPAVSYVDPGFIGEGAGTSNDDHPFGDVRAGEVFMNSIYEAVTSSPLWERIALFITFDEWGGFFDHVAPTKGADLDPTHALRGFRIPTLVISPRARRNFVAKALYDHSSILKFIEWRWGLPAMTPRDAAATNIAQAFNWTEPADLTAPQWTVTPPPAADVARRASHLPMTEHDLEMEQLAVLAARHGMA
jgi:phospholipase C